MFLLLCGYCDQPLEPDGGGVEVYLKDGEYVNTIAHTYCEQNYSDPTGGFVQFCEFDPFDLEGPQGLYRFLGLLQARKGWTDESTLGFTLCYVLNLSHTYGVDVESQVWEVYDAQ